MSNPIEAVEEWMDSGCENDHVPVEELKALVEHAKKSDTYVRKMYRVIGFMFRDACRAMEIGSTDAYRSIPLDRLFDRVHMELDLPAPLDLPPEEPEAANAPDMEKNSVIELLH